MRSCDEIRELLSAALDGQLTADEQAALDDHIAHCPACSALLDDLRSLQAATAHMEDIPAPAGFAEAVMAAVAAESAQNQDDNVVPFSAKLNRKPRPRWSRWVASVAAVAIIAVGAASLPDLMGGSKNASFDLAEPTAMEDSVSIQAEAMESLPQTSILSDGSDPYSAVSDSYSVESAESTVVPLHQPAIV